MGIVLDRDEQNVAEVRPDANGKALSVTGDSILPYTGHSAFGTRLTLLSPRAAAAEAGWMNDDQPDKLFERSEFLSGRHSSVRLRVPAIALAIAGKTAGDHGV